MWIVLILIAGLGTSTVFACITPFAALATLAVLNLDRRDALVVAGLIWIVNQIIGYGLLGYPWTWNSVGWGLAIGASVGMAALATRVMSTERPVAFAVSLPFMASFASFELTLYVAGFVLGGSAGAFSFSVIEHVLMVNVVALACLIVLFRLAMLTAMLPRVNTMMTTRIEPRLT